jgi:hypothetical protein
MYRVAAFQSFEEVIELHELAETIGQTVTLRMTLAGEFIINGLMFMLLAVVVVDDDDNNRMNTVK